MVEKQIQNSDEVLKDIVESPYKYGFKTEIETEDFPKGLNQDIITQIANKKNEPSFLRDFRTKAFNIWEKMESPDWAYLDIVETNIENEKGNVTRFLIMGKTISQPELGKDKYITSFLFKLKSKTLIK